MIPQFLFTSNETFESPTPQGPAHAVRGSSSLPLLPNRMLRTPKSAAEVNYPTHLLPKSLPIKGLGLVDIL
jgi:hypothetical protein